MPWTETTRAQYRRAGLRYASNLTDAEWALIARRMPRRRHLGRPRKVDLRRVVEAILFIVSTGCQWRALPKEFPPYSTVQSYFYSWRDLPLNFHPAAIRASANVTPFGAVSVPA